MRTKIKRYLLIAIAAVLLALGGAWQFRIASNSLVAAPPAQFKLIDGRVIELAQLRGKVVLVDFWATSCVICMAELPDIARLSNELQAQGLEVIAVAMPYDRPDYVMDYARKSDLGLNIALDLGGDLVNHLGPVRGTPTLVLIDREGQIAARLEGPQAPGTVRSLLTKLL